jgi:hypothetical protein
VFKRFHFCPRHPIPFQLPHPCGFLGISAYSNPTYEQNQKPPDVSHILFLVAKCPSKTAYHKIFPSKSLYQVSHFWESKRIPIPLSSAVINQIDIVE